MKKALFVSLLFVSFSTSPISAQDYWDGETYSKNSSSQKEAAGDLMKYVPLQGNEQVLDVGCGDGKITAALAKKISNGSIIGVDISVSMIDFAKKTFPQNDYPNLQFFVQDAQKLDYKEDFDLIVSFTALQWIPDHAAFVKGAYRALKPAGLLAITMPLNPPKALEQATKEIIASSEWSPYFQHFSSGWNFVDKTEYAHMLRQQRFALIRYEVVPQQDIFPSQASFESFLGQIFPYLRPLPQELKKPFLSQIVDRFLELETAFPNGEVHWKFPRIEIVAKKI